jgi:hypothetical protein
MLEMKKAFAGTAVCILLMYGLWLGNHGGKPAGTDAPTSSRSKHEGTGSNDGTDLAGPSRTKVINREPTGPRATHSPERLKDFMLPEIALEGLTLAEALQKLMGVYGEACKKSGEVPLRLSFDVPPGAAKKLNLRLSGRNFTSSVQLLAALSGMTASRNGLAYQFKPIIDERKPVSRSIQVPPDISSMLGELAGRATAADSPPQIPVSELFRKLLSNLDPSTRLSLTASGILNLETTSTADAAAVAALIQGVSQRPLQHKFTAKVVNLAAGVEWTPPDVSQMTDAQLHLLMHEMAQIKGTELMTLPSVTSRGGQSSNVELIREWIVPIDDSEEEFETYNVGQVMQLQASALGFGHDVAFDFSDTTAEVDAETGKPSFIKRIDVKDSGFSTDNGTRFVVQTRPDGSKSVVLVTSTMIDATGRPLHGSE